MSRSRLSGDFNDSSLHFIVVVPQHRCSSSQFLTDSLISSHLIVEVAGDVYEQLTSICSTFKKTSWSIREGKRELLVTNLSCSLSCLESPHDVPYLTELVTDMCSTRRWTSLISCRDLSFTRHTAIVHTTQQLIRIDMEHIYLYVIEAINPRMNRKWRHVVRLKNLLSFNWFSSSQHFVRWGGGGKQGEK